MGSNWNRLTMRGRLRDLSLARRYKKALKHLTGNSMVNYVKAMHKGELAIKETLAPAKTFVA